MEAIETFLEILEDLMTENEMSVACLASKINLNKSAIHRWKQKSFFPQPSTILKLTEIFQVSADYLFGRTENRDFVPSNLPETFWVRYSDLKENRDLQIIWFPSIAKSAAEQFPNGNISTAYPKRELCSI